MNAWAKAILVDRKTLEDTGRWDGEKDFWRDAASANFSRSLFLVREAKEPTAGIKEKTMDAEVSIPIQGAWIDFSGFLFPDDTSFHSSTFTGATFFDGAVLIGNASFECTTFSRRASFARVTFSGETLFETATFSGTAWFLRASFAGDTYFNSASFSGEAGFVSATFSNAANFNNANFFSRANFDMATFAGGAGFSGQTFANDASFRRGNFGDQGRADFRLTTFERAALFDGAVFKGEADFGAVLGKRNFSMAGAQFERVPDFIQAHFEEAPRLDNVLVEPPEGVEPLTEEEAHALFARWRALKRLAIQAHDTDRELEFNAQEIRAERLASRWPKLPRSREDCGDWLRALSGALYGFFSDYGRSLLRPFGFWILAIAVSAAFYLSQTEVVQREMALRDSPSAVGYALLNSAPCYPPPLTSSEHWRKRWRWRGEPLPDPNQTHVDGLTEKLRSQTNARAEALHLAFRNAFVVLDGGSDASHRMYGCLYGLELYAGQNPVPIVPSAVSTASAIQKLISGVLIFLFGLALRNMLKVK